MNKTNYCKCMVPLDLSKAITALKEEVIEFIEKPSMDELSDCTFGMGRLIAGLFGRVYISMPLDGRHKQKIEDRMQEYGCIRSKRYLRNGRCPSDSL